MNPDSVPANHSETEDRSSAGNNQQDDDLIPIPRHRRHDSGHSRSLRGLPVALLLAVPGSLLLGAGYGALLALCGEFLINLTVVCSFPFWMHIPSQLGLMCGHVQHARWRSRIGVCGFFACLYGMYVGWLAAVLDGPGLVLNPWQLVTALADIRLHSLWVQNIPLIDADVELWNLEPWVLLARAAELLWIGSAGLMSCGAELPFPYCTTCRKWMHDSATVRFHYTPVSLDQVRQLAGQLTEDCYEELLQMRRTVGEKDKGLEVSVFGCPGCGNRHVMNVRLYQVIPESDQSETEQMLQSAAGIPVVSSLQIPGAVREHFVSLSDRSAA